MAKPNTSRQSSTFWWLIGIPGSFGVFLLLFYRAEILGAWPLGDWPGTDWEIIRAACFFWVCLIWVALVVLYRLIIRFHRQFWDPSSALYAVEVAAVTLFAGIFASFARVQIQGAFPFPVEALLHPAQWKFNWVATVFWIFVIWWSFLFFRRQKAEGERMAKLREVTKHIEDAVQTLPHEEFRTMFVEQMTDVQAFLEGSFSRKSDTADKEKVAESIRYLLASIASLAQAYDSKMDASYRANVMYFIERGATEPYFGKDVWNKVRFGPRECTEDKARGVLMLEKALSSTASSGGEEDDSMTRNIAFVIPHDFEQHLNWILPGAPLAFVEQVFHGHDDIWNLNKPGQPASGLDENIIGELTGYYRDGGEGKTVRSFLSIPLIRSANSATGINTRDAAFAVLNIHSDKEFMLGGSQRKQEVFTAVAVPLINEIAWATNVWLNKS